MFNMYCIFKQAVEGFSEALFNKVKSEWNIHFACVELGDSVSTRPDAL